MNATALVNPSVQLADGAAVIRSAREPRPAAGAGEIFSASLATQRQAMAASSSEPSDGAPSVPHAVKPGKVKVPKQDGAPVTATALPQGQVAVPQAPANAAAADAGESAGSPQAGAVTGTMAGTQAGQPLPETGKDLPLTLPPLPTAAPMAAVPTSVDAATDRPPPKIGDVLAALLGDAKPQAAPAAPTGGAAVRDAPPTASVTPASARPSAVTSSAVTSSAVTSSAVTGTEPAAPTQAPADVPFLHVSLGMEGEGVSGAPQGKNPEPGPLSSQAAPVQPAPAQTGFSHAGGAHDQAQSIEGLVLSGQTLKVSEAQHSSGKEGSAGDPMLQNVAGLDRSVALGTSAPTPEIAGPTAIMPGGTAPEARPAAVVSTAQPAISMPLNHESWDKALGQHMLGMLQRDVQQAELHLHPPELGSLEVRIALSQEQASVAFSSPHGAVREALEAAVPRLRQMFAETGINLIDVNVSQHSFAQHSQREQSGLTSYAAPFPAPASLPDAGIASVTTVGSSRLVDYYA